MLPLKASNVGHSQTNIKIGYCRDDGEARLKSVHVHFGLGKIGIACVVGVLHMLIKDDMVIRTV